MNKKFLKPNELFFWIKELKKHAIENICLVAYRLHYGPRNDKQCVIREMATFLQFDTWILNIVIVIFY